MTGAKTRPVNRVKVPLWIVLSVHLLQPLGKTLTPRSQRILTRKWTLRVTKAILMPDDGHGGDAFRDRTFEYCFATDKLENSMGEKKNIILLVS